MKKNNKKPVVLITGYLGSGKTTLLNNLLRQEKRWDEEFGDRVNQLVIIGKSYNKEAIEAELRKCLDEKAIA